MELPLGITGFFDRRDRLPAGTDFKQFLSDCHTLSRELRGHILAYRDSGQLGGNFSLVELQLPDRKVCMLINSIYPYVAIGLVPNSDEVVFSIVDDLQLANALETCHRYRRVTAVESGMPVTAQACSRLSKAEMKQIHYWKPLNLGAVIYNRWD